MQNYAGLRNRMRIRFRRSFFQNVSSLNGGIQGKTRLALIFFALIQALLIMLKLPKMVAVLIAKSTLYIFVMVCPPRGKTLVQNVLVCMSAMK
jgi:hypothetical protein